jgi:hypothetical protein
MARSGKATINTMASLPGCQHSNQREACAMQQRATTKLHNANSRSIMRRPQIHK